MYVGLGYHLDVYSGIMDRNLDVPNGKITEHYMYSVARGIDPTYYSMSGLSANFVFDSRDNQINPYKGFYVNAQYRYNTAVLGSTTNSGSAWLEVRGYKSLSATRPRHILAGWAYTNFSAGGTLPYLGLSGTNYDMKNRSAGLMCKAASGVKILCMRNLNTAFRFPNARGYWVAYCLSTEQPHQIGLTQ